jgi:hypothetical protein
LVRIGQWYVSKSIMGPVRPNTALMATNCHYVATYHAHTGLRSEISTVLYYH